MLTNNHKLKYCQICLDEDIGTGDITTMTVVPPDVVVDAHIEAKAQEFWLACPWRRWCLKRSTNHNLGGVAPRWDGG